MSRPALIITGGRELPPTPPRAPEPSPAPAQRPGCLPSCCGALHGLNGGHARDCEFRPQRVFDHLDSGQDEQLSTTAHHMRRSSWWLAWVGREERHSTLEPVAGEIGAAP